MSKPVTLASKIAGLFGRSGKTISETLSTEAHEEFAADVDELSGKLEAAEAETARVTALLETATTQITTLEASVTEKEGQITTLNTQLTTATSERDKYKAHYDESANRGGKEGNEDANSRGKSAKSGYNANALSVWQKHNQ
mgnify:CR=1 FL=1